MKEIKLSQRSRNSKHLVALVDDADYEYLNQWKWQINIGHVTYYAQRIDLSNGGRRRIAMHRQILGLTDPKILVDHIDHNGLNNQRSNIRAATNSQNLKNRKPTGTSKYLGVSFYKNSSKWVSQIVDGRKKVCIGYFDSEEVAALAYNEKAKQVHGEFANLNIINA